MKANESKVPLYIQTACTLREEIKKGAIAPGERISHRKVGERYGVSKKTVSEALDILQSEGLVICKPRIGTFVNRLWLPLVEKSTPAWSELVKNSSSVPSGDQIYSIYQLISSNPKNLLGGTSISKDFNFHKPVKIAMERAIHRIDDTNDFYSVNITGLAVLRENIAKHMTKSGIYCEGENVLVTTGPMEALSLVLLSLLRRGMKLFIESTSILGAPTFARFTGADIVRVACDEEGIIPEDFIEKTRKVRSDGVLCLSPVNQYPTGASLSKARRDAIMSTCVSKNIPIIEYDLLRDFKHGSFPKPFKSFDVNDMVIYIGSFMSSYQNMKLGWVIAPQQIVRHITDTKTQYEININTVVQLVADEMLASGVYVDYTEEYTPRFIERLRLCRMLFEKYFTGIATWGKEEEAFYQWLEFAKHINTYNLLKQLSTTFVHSGYFFNPADINRIYINPMGDNVQNLDDGLKEIAAIARQML